MTMTCSSQLLSYLYRKPFSSVLVYLSGLQLYVIYSNLTQTSSLHLINTCLKNKRNLVMLSPEKKNQHNAHQSSAVRVACPSRQDWIRQNVKNKWQKSCRNQWQMSKNQSWQMSRNQWQNVKKKTMANVKNLMAKQT